MKRLNLLLVALLLASCSSEQGAEGVETSSAPSNNQTGVYMLLDTSGTYRQELVRAEQIIRYTLSRLNPEDSFAVARIDTGSFSEKDIVAKVSFDDRPSAVNQQKRVFAEQVHQFVETADPSPYTDITGGMLQAVEWLNEKDSGRKTILVFSDMQQDLESGYVRDIDLPLEGFEVIALNVTKLRSDNVDPREYLDRLDMWRDRVESTGGTWRVINDLDNLDGIF